MLRADSSEPGERGRGRIEINRGFVSGMLALLIGVFFSLGPGMAQSPNLDLGISISDGSLRGFYLAIGDYYGVQPRQVVDFRQRYRCPEDELPVVYFVAARARVEPAAVMNLRLGKMSWLDIAFHFRLTPEIFFVPLATERVGPPYGNAYGYYRKYGPSGDWRKIRLSDREVVDLVNLKFLSEHYRMAPEAVMAMRGRESKFVVINDGIRRNGGKGKTEKQGQNPKGKGNGKKKYGS